MRHGAVEVSVIKRLRRTQLEHSRERGAATIDLGFKNEVYEFLDHKTFLLLIVASHWHSHGYQHNVIGSLDSRIPPITGDCGAPDWTRTS